MTRVFVLGHRGMLGHVVAKYLHGLGLAVLTTDIRYSGKPRDGLIEEIRNSGADWVINAIGRIKQKNPTVEELYRINTQLPLQLAARLLPAQRLLHPSTDCVFSGRDGGYRTTDEPDAE